MTLVQRYSKVKFIYSSAIIIFALAIALSKNQFQTGELAGLRTRSILISSFSSSLACFTSSSSTFSFLRV